MWLFNWRYPRAAAMTENRTIRVLCFTVRANNAFSLCRFLLHVLLCSLNRRMRFTRCNSECSLKLYSNLIKSIPQLIRRISRVCSFALIGFSAAFRAKISIISNFFTTVRTVNQSFSPYVCMIYCEFKPL